MKTFLFLLFFGQSIVPEGPVTFFPIYFLSSILSLLLLFLQAFLLHHPPPPKKETTFALTFQNFQDRVEALTDSM